MLWVLIRFAYRGDSNDFSNSTIFNIIIFRKITLNYPKFAAMGFFPGTQERVRNSRGKRVISVFSPSLFLLWLWPQVFDTPGLFHYFSGNSMTTLMAPNRVLSIQYVLGIVRGVFGVLIIKQILSRVRRFDCFVIIIFVSFQFSDYLHFKVNIFNFI